MKKITALFLCLTLFLSIVPVASAKSAEEVGSGYDASYVPQLHINTENGNGTSLEKADGYTNATFSIDDGNAEPIIVKVRGNSTAMTPKKAFTFKFEKKKDLFGMGKGKKWVLLANAFDPTLLRNYVAFDFAQELGIAYTSNQKIVELWLDGKFRGCYTLMEPVQEGKDRVDIDIDGNKDFLLELERSRVDEDTTYITTKDGLRFAVSEPDEPDNEQVNYITSEMNRYTDIINSGNEEEIRANIDVDSFVKFFVINEFVKMNDFNFSSVFFYSKNSKLCAGPPWDFDLTMGNVNKDFSANSAEAIKPEGEYIYDKLFYKKLYSYDWFKNLICLEYERHSKYIRNIYKDGGLIDSLARDYKPVFDRNYNEAGWKIRYLINVMMYPLPTYEENLEYFKSWVAQRDKWLSEFYRIDTLPFRTADCDGDSIIDIKDATLLQKALAMLTDLTDIQNAAADVNRDGIIDIRDVTEIQKIAASFKSE
ncbi:MAG TPA: hypothetical protein DEO32_02330 [Ruminococcaceae bacterium]|nr:hypothetical protein [Oscillospiraceae bacterium]